MWIYPKEIELIEHFKKNAKIAGIIFMLIGFVAAVFPIAASYATVVFVSWLMLLAGILAGYFTYITDKEEWSGWLKSIILIGVALYMLFSPLHGVATLGLLFSIYFFMDAFSNFTMASTRYPNKGWGIWGVNAVLSMLMAILFIVGWPFSSMYLIGFIVGFSLFFDGLALFMGAKVFGDFDKDLKA